MKKNKIILAAVAGLMTGLVGVSIPGHNSLTTVQSADAADTAVAPHACKGANQCKGTNECKGTNVCKGTCGCATDGSK